MKGSIEYTLQGHGPVLLVCHGTSENCYSGSSLAPLLNAGFSLLTISRPGYGRTPSDVGRSNTEAADALVALLDHLAIPQCSVIAISGGGPTGVALAANYPVRVNSLVLIAANTLRKTVRTIWVIKARKHSMDLCMVYSGTCSVCLVFFRLAEPPCRLWRSFPHMIQKIQ